MKKKPRVSLDASALRQRAEQKLRDQPPLAEQARIETDTRALVHELQVHQIELEMQNEELHRTQLEAQQAADKYTELFDFAPVGYFVLDASGVVRAVNLAGAALLGRDRQHVTGQPFEKFVVADSRADFSAFCRGLQPGEGRRSCELRLRQHDHRHCDVLVEATGAGDESGPDHGCRLAVTDITERKRIEAALLASERRRGTADALVQLNTELERRLLERTATLRESEAQFRAMFETASIGIAQADPQTGRWLRVNQKICTITGYSADEMLQMRVPDITHPEDRARDSEAFQQVVRGEAPDYRMEKRYVRKDGTLAWVNVNMTVIRDASGQPTRTVATIEDIAPRKRAEEALRESEAKYRSLFESSRDAVMTLEPPSWRFTSGNQATVEMFEARNEEEFTSHGPWELSPGQQPDGRDSVEKAREMIETALREGSHLFEWTHRRLGGQEFSAIVLLSRMQSDGKVFLQATVRDITERKQAETALRESELLYHSLVEQLPQAIFRLDRAGRITFANSRYCQQMGRELKALLGQTDADLFPADLAAQYWADSRRVIETGQIFDAIERHSGLDGRESYVHVMKSPLRGADGQIVGVQCLFSDVTERKQAEEQLRASEERFRSLYENSVVGFYRTTPDGCILMANPALLNMLGFSSLEELASRNLEDEGFEPGCSRAAFKQRLEQDGQIIGLEAGWKRSDGSTIFVRENCRAVRDESGRTVFYDGSAEDITARKQAEAALREAHEFNQQIIASAREGIIVHDRDGNHRVWNPFMEELTGFPAAKVVGQRPLDVFPFLRAYDFDRMFQRALAGEIFNSPDMFYDGGRKGRKAWTVVRFAPLRDGSGIITGVIAMLNDITERKKLERQILEVSEREQERIGADLHDGVSQLLTGGTFMNDSVRQRLAAQALPEAADVQRVGELLTQLQRDLRHVARGLQPVVPAPEGLMAALTELTESVSERCGIACRVNCPQRVLVHDNSMATHLFRIAKEAVHNAVRHGRPKKITVELTEEKGTLVLQVQDNGRGLRSAHGQEAGLGLRIMKSRSEAMSGKLEVGPVRPHGTLVRCTVPVPAPARRKKP